MSCENPLILCINPGSTSTKIALFRGTELQQEAGISHSSEDLKDFERIFEQKEYRASHAMKFLADNGIELTDLSAVVGRGGMMKPVTGGTYEVNDVMLDDLQNYSLKYYGSEHISNLGAALAKEIAHAANAKAYIVDPISTDDFTPVSRLSGVPEVERVSLMHSLNLRAKARKVAQMTGTTFEQSNFVGCHLGGGISMAAFAKGRAIDSNHGLLGYGPFSPQRAGTLAISSVMDMCLSGEYTPSQLRKKFAKNSGFTGYLGTDDGREVMRMMDEGDELASAVFTAMAVQIAKEAAALSAVLKGDVKSVFITGGLANAKRLTDMITEHVKFVAPVHILPGEDELQAMSEGAVRALSGDEPPLTYKADDSLKARLASPEKFKVLSSFNRG